MSPAIISLLVTASADTWLYTKLMKYSGNNTQQSIIAAVVAGLIIFFICYSILSLIFK